MFNHLHQFFIIFRKTPRIKTQKKNYPATVINYLCHIALLPRSIAQPYFFFLEIKTRCFHWWVKLLFFCFPKVIQRNPAPQQKQEPSTIQTPTQINQSQPMALFKPSKCTTFTQQINEKKVKSIHIRTNYWNSSKSLQSPFLKAKSSNLWFSLILELQIWKKVSTFLWLGTPPTCSSSSLEHCWTSLWIPDSA